MKYVIVCPLFKVIIAQKHSIKLILELIETTKRVDDLLMFSFILSF